MVLELITNNDNFTTFKLGDNYLVVEYTHEDKVMNFQNGLITKALLARVRTYISFDEINKIIFAVRNVQVSFI